MRCTSASPRRREPFRRARGLSPFPAINYPDPYFQTITYDAFAHSNRSGKLYSGEPPSDNGSYVGNRRTGWQYDADGNAVSDSSYQQTIDASGTNIRSVSHAKVGDGVEYPFRPRLDITQTYDGTGQPAKRVQISRLPGLGDEFGNPGEPIEDTQTTHYVKSTVLGGATVAELGWGDTIHIYAAGQRIAREFMGNVTFEHQNPVNGSWVTSHGHSSYRTTAREERDPRGAEMPLSNPYGQAGSYVDWRFSQPLFVEGGDPFDYGSGREIDGIPVTEAEFQRRFRFGDLCDFTQVGQASIGAGESRAAMRTDENDRRTRLKLDRARARRTIGGKDGYTSPPTASDSGVPRSIFVTLTNSAASEAFK